MNIQAYAAAKATAIKEIGEKLEINLAPEALPKAPEPKILELFRLQKIAKYAGQKSEPEYDSNLAEVLAKIEDVKGVGIALFAKIEEALRE